MEAPVGSTYEFGPFEVNPASGELLKYGRRVKVQEQPFRLLVILLENAGHVVTREQIQNHIWEGNTFVDFDSSLRVAVRKLREALGDDAENPRYIETIPKRGYRFIAPAPRTAEPIRREAEMTPAAAPAPAESPGSKRWPWALALLLLLLIASGAGTVLFLARDRRVVSAKDTVVLGDFANQTGDPVFDETLRQGLEIELEQSPFLKLISEERIHQTLSLMGQPPDAKLTPAIARELCQREASAAVLDGSIAQVGAQYLLTLKAIDCVNGESLASTETRASDKNHVLEALGKTASVMRYKVGESLSAVRKFNTPLEQATTPSLDALKAFSSGRRVWFAEGEPGAIPFFKRAIELDPNFALAYAWLGVSFTTLGESSVAAGYTRKAYDLRARTSDPEKYFISSVFYKEVTGNLANAEQTCKFWNQDYPRSEMPHTYLAGAIYPSIGQYEKAVEEAREAITLKVDTPITYAFLMFDDMALLRLDEAQAAYEQARQRKLYSPLYPLAFYQIAFLQNDGAKMAQQVAGSAGQPGVEDELLGLEADTAAYSGQLREAREFSQRAMNSAELAKENEGAATYLALSALREALFGNPEEARRRATLATERSTARDVQYGTALALMFAGDDRRARALGDDLGKRFPEDTIVQFNYLPTLRAKNAVTRNNTAEALKLLGAAKPYELGQSTASTYGWTALYPVYVRGEAYLAARKGKEAGAEFQKILDHRGVVVNQPIGALAHLQIGRANAMQGETVKARAAYQDFFTLWKHADPDIPIFKQAKQEYAELQ
jgi:DNA-binding winged helix-turn-helix (wHTH) protein/tetratricopeptide (TPR) repeat protein